MEESRERLPSDAAGAMSRDPVPAISAAAVSQRIREALYRSAEQRADAIQVDVRGGAVTLSGTVQSWQERGEIQRAAWSLHGVETVDDRLIVSS